MPSRWWPEIKQLLQCPVDEDAEYENTTWCNRDLIPIPPERRTYGVWSYFGYWTVSGSCISAWSTGSTLLSFGLSPQQAIGVVILGGFLSGLLAVFCGWMGEVHHIGFTVSSRFSWGTRGSYFPVILRTFVSCMWFGMQAFWGGKRQGLRTHENYFAASSHRQTNDFIGLVIWMCGFIPAGLMRPEKLQIPFFVCFVFFCGSCFGMIIWAVSQANGPGNLFHQPGSAPNTGWAFMFGITAIIGSWGSGTLGQSDWVRYSKRRYAPTLSQLVACPFTIAITATIGIIVTSASNKILGGEIQWNPIYLLADIQEHYRSSPRVRAGVFFASLGMVASQFSISVVLNSVSCGMDLAGLWPKYLNIRRWGYVMAVIGIATQPWQLISTADKFLSVLSSFGVFMAPASLKVSDLYRGDSMSIYWFRQGVNWRAFAAFTAGMWPLLPGLAANVSAWDSGQWVGWLRLYNLRFIVGVAISFVVFWEGPFLVDGEGVIDGVERTSGDLPGYNTAEGKKGVEVSVV
ncbi:permease for cytosine/purines, uracil, thiamine, allantoin-domain-containing protein [Aspergillus aurantiobrunneus]